MAQYVYTMMGVGKVVPPKREILKDISLSFFPGAKIGVLGLNGAGKSTLLRIMAGLDTDIHGEARPMPGIKTGYLAQEPHLDPAKDVRGNVEDGMHIPLDALAGLEKVFAAYGDEDADYEVLGKQQEEYEKLLMPGMHIIWRIPWNVLLMHCVCRRGMFLLNIYPVAKNGVWLSAVYYFQDQTCYYWMNRPTILMRNLFSGWNVFWRISMVRSLP